MQTKYACVCPCVCVLMCVCPHAGVYEWHGLNPMPPEMWLLPYKWWTGIGMLHPGRFWCHCRMVSLCV